MSESNCLQPSSDVNCGNTEYKMSVLRILKQQIFNCRNELNNRYLLLFNARLLSQLPGKKLETEEYSIKADEDLETETRLKEDEDTIEKKRNKSMLWPQHYNILHGKKPYNEPVSEMHESMRYNRKMFGRYGYESGVNPGTLWPIEEELKERNEYEKIAFPYTIQKMWERAKERRENEERIIEERQMKIANNLKKLNQWKKEIEVRAAKKLELAAAAKAKKDALIEEVRRHFGFNVDPKDERFKEMLLKKEKDQKKKLKEEKAKAKHERMLTLLMKKETS